MVGHPAAVRVAAGDEPGAGDRAPRAHRCSSAARSSSSRPGSLNVQLWYPWHFDFVGAHYYGALVFLASLVAARDGQDAGDRRAPIASARGRCRAVAPTRRPRRSPGAGCSGSSAARRPDCSWSTAGQSSAGRCGGWRCSRRAARGRRAAQRLPGQQDRCRRAHHAGDDRRGAGSLDGDRRAPALARPRRAAGDAAAHVRAADRVRRGLVDDPALDRRAARRPGRAGRRARRLTACVRVAAGRAARFAGRRSATPRSPTTARCSRCRSTAPTCPLDHGYPGAHHRPRAAGRALHQVGRARHVRAEVRRLLGAPARARRAAGRGRLRAQPLPAAARPDG